MKETQGFMLVMVLIYRLVIGRKVDEGRDEDRGLSCDGGYFAILGFAIQERRWRWEIPDWGS